MVYFSQQIQIAQMFGHTLAMPNAQNAGQWIERIENELSPENLSCDGELPRSAVARKAAMLNEALAHCRTFLPESVLMSPGAGFFSAREHFALRVAKSAFRRERTQQRESKLIAAVQDGFTVGARVQISNGVRGTSVKINRTRVEVKVRGSMRHARDESLADIARRALFNVGLDGLSVRLPLRRGRRRRRLRQPDARSGHRRAQGHHRNRHRDHIARGRDQASRRPGLRYGPRHAPDPLRP